MQLNRSWLLGTLGVVVLISLACLLAFVIPETCLTCARSRSCYRAAVFDHVQQVDPKGNDKLVDIELNLQVFESAAKTAKQNGADIVVFPEYGIVFNIATRQEALQFGENIPAEKVDVCTDVFAKSAPQIYRLACMAKQNKIFVAANVIDVQDCSSNCPADKKYAFNTAVLFDRNGYILGKYHKMQPFGEMALNVPPTDELVVIDTELGRLSMQVCFDMIYSKPGVQLAAQNKIDTMVFPTWWFDELPFLAASQYQMAWSFGNKINLLASNIHKIQVGSKGSGIYAGGKGQFEVINVADSKSRLLVATLPVSPTSNAQCDLNPVTVEVNQKVPIPSNLVYRYQSMNLTQTEVVKVDLNKMETSKCSGGVCCTLRYKVDKPTIKSTEGFHLIVTNRTRPGAYPWTEEFCGLVHCPQLANLNECTLIRSNTPLETKFTYVELIGEFSPDAYIYPSVVGSEHQLLTMANNLWSYSEDLSNKTKLKYVLTFGDKASTKKSYPVSTIGLYGRVYSRDPPYVQKPTGGIL